MDRKTPKIIIPCPGESLQIPHRHPDSLVHKIIYDGKYDCMGNCDSNLGATGGQPQKNAWREDEKQQSGIQRRDPVHLYTLVRYIRSTKLLTYRKYV
jgi:hypothetical protein